MKCVAGTTTSLLVMLIAGSSKPTDCPSRIFPCGTTSLRQIKSRDGGNARGFSGSLWGEPVMGRDAHHGRLHNNGYVVFNPGAK